MSHILLRHQSFGRNILFYYPNLQYHEIFRDSVFLELCSNFTYYFKILLDFSACSNYVGALAINFLQPNFVHFLKLVKVCNSYTLIPTSPAQLFNYLLLEINAFVHPTPQLIVVLKIQS